MRVRTNFLSGTLTASLSDSASTTMQSAELANLPAVAAPHVAAITVDPLGLTGDPETRWVTAHTAGATVATVAGSKEGSTARSHLSGVEWRHVPTKGDFSPEISGSAYELIGDGVATDTTPLVNVIAAAAGGAVRLPSGTHLFDGSLPASSNTAIRGNGIGATILKIKSGSSGAAQQGIVGVNVANVVIEDLTIDLNKAGTTDAGGSSVQQGIYFYASTAQGVSNCKVNRVEVKNGWNNGLMATSSVPGTNGLDVAFTDCFAHDCENNGIYSIGATQARYIGNRCAANGISGISDDASTGSVLNGNVCFGNLWQGITMSASAASKNFAITGNVCQGNGSAGAAVGAGIVLSLGSQFFTVTGNTCSSNYHHGISVDTALVGNDNGQYSIGTVAGNTCNNNTNAHGIYISYALLVAVTGNTCALNGGHGIAVQAAQDTVDGNLCYGNTGYGISLEHDGVMVPGMGNHTIGVNRLDSNTAGPLFENANCVQSHVAPLPVVGVPTGGRPGYLWHRLDGGGAGATHLYYNNAGTVIGIA